MSATTTARATRTAATVSRAAPRSSAGRATATIAPRRASRRPTAAAASPHFARPSSRPLRAGRFAAAAAPRADLDTDDDLMDIADDDDDDYPGFMGRAWADDDADDLGVSITPDQRRAAVRLPAAPRRGRRRLGRARGGRRDEGRRRRGGRGEHVDRRRDGDAQTHRRPIGTRLRSSRCQRAAAIAIGRVTTSSPTRGVVVRKRRGLVRARVQGGRRPGRQRAREGAAPQPAPAEGVRFRRQASISTSPGTSRTTRITNSRWCSRSRSGRGSGGSNTWSR